MEICRRSINIPGLVIGLINHNKTEIYNVLSNPVFEIPSFNFDFMLLDKTHTTQTTASNLTYVTHAAGRYIYVCKCNNKYIFYIYDGRMLRIDVVSLEELENIKKRMVQLWEVLTAYDELVNVSFELFYMIVGNIKIPLLRDVIISLRKALSNPELIPEKPMDENSTEGLFRHTRDKFFEQLWRQDKTAKPDYLYEIASYPGGNLYIEHIDTVLIFNYLGDISLQSNAFCLKRKSVDEVCELMLNKLNDYVEVIYGKI